LPTFHPSLSTRDTTSTCALAQIFYLICWESLKAASSSKDGLKGMVQLNYNFTHAWNPMQNTTRDLTWKHAL